MFNSVMSKLPRYSLSFSYIWILSFFIASYVDFRISVFLRCETLKVKNQVVYMYVLYIYYIQIYAIYMGQRAKKI